MTGENCCNECGLCFDLQLRRRLRETVISAPGVDVGDEFEIIKLTCALACVDGYVMGAAASTGGAGAAGSYVTDSLRLVLKSSSRANRDTYIGGLNRFFEQARQRSINGGVGAPVFVDLRYCGESEWWSSELAMAGDDCKNSPIGQISYTSEVFGWLLCDGLIEADVTWSRRGQWERTYTDDGTLPEAAVTMSNPASSGTSVMIANEYNPTLGRYNYVDIEATAIEGDTPVPLNFSYSLLGCVVDTLWVGQRYGDLKVLSPQHWFDGGQWQAIAATTPTPAPGSSLESFLAVSWAGTAETALGFWFVDLAGLNIAEQNVFKPLLRIRDLNSLAAGELKLRLALYNTAGTQVLWQGEPFMVSDTSQEILDLGAVEFPYSNDPTGALSLGYTTPRLAVLAQHRLSGTHNLQVDWLQLTPLTGYRKLVPPDALSIWGSGQLLDWQSASFLSHDYSAKTGPLWVQPGRSTRLYCVWTLKGEYHYYCRLTLSAFYYPRRLNP